MPDSANTRFPPARAANSTARAALWFCITQADHALKTRREVARIVRLAITELGGTAPHLDARRKKTTP